MTNSQSNIELHYTKIRDVKDPVRAHPTDAGIDFFVPNEQAWNVKAHEDALIPSGIKLRLPEGYALIFFNKSSIPVKTGLIVGACVVDEKYFGDRGGRIYRVPFNPCTPTRSRTSLAHTGMCHLRCCRTKNCE